ncbi:MAG: LuxR C-terminal-related transcriptional regulator [Bacteroidota bacterium]
MPIEEKNMDKFIESIHGSFNKKLVDKKNFNNLKHIPLNINEGLYLLDIEQNKIIYKRGFKNLLGCDRNYITFNFLLNSIHPDDSEITQRVTRVALLHSLEYPENSKNNVLQICYRRKIKDGSYIKVLSQTSVFNVDTSGLATCFLIKLTDISFLDKSDNVNWNFISDDLDREVFNEKVYSIYNRTFTKRERQVIKEIVKGNPNKFIADTLNVSEHTIATHRKNILRKSNCHNIEELVIFCKGKGII